MEAVSMFKILIAEDDPSTNLLFCAILRRAGYEPVSAVDGEDALQNWMNTISTCFCAIL